MDFNDVIAPISRDAFFDKYWTKNSARLEGRRGRFSKLLTWDALNAILEQHRLAPPRLGLWQNGSPLKPEQYLANSVGAPRLHAGLLAACLAEGATLVLNDVHEMAPHVRDLAQSFQESLHTATHVNLYASWRSQNAFDVHWDAHEAFIVQLSGRKHWKVYRSTQINPLKDDDPPQAKPTQSPVWEGILEDGDAIYIPRGWWHVATPLNEPSLHLNLAVTSPLGLDFLYVILARLKKYSEVRANLPLPGSAREQKALLERLRQILDESLSGSTIEDFWRDWEANIGPNEPRIRLPMSPAEQRAVPTSSSRIRLAASNRLQLISMGNNFEFNANNKIWTVPPEIAPALAALKHSQSISLAELSALVAGNEAISKLEKSIGVLARAGIILIESE